MRIRKRLVSWIFALALATLGLIGCTSSSPSQRPESTAPLQMSVAQPPSDLATPPSDLPAASIGPTRASAAEVQPDPSGDASLPHDSVSLEGRLPTEALGVALTVYSVRGDDDDGSSFLRQLGVPATDVTAAVASDPTGEMAGSITALTVANMPADELLDAILSVLEVHTPMPAQVTPALIDGRPVMKVVSGESPTRTRYLYAVEEIVFMADGGDEETAGRWIALIP